MKILILIAVLCSVPVLASAHPGKTDHQGGHRCLKQCEEWDLYYNEYHLHDKDGRAIRIARKPKKKPARSLLSEPTASTAQPIADSVLSVQTVTVYRPVVTVREPDETFRPYLWVLVAILFLWLLVRMIRKKESGR